MGSTAEKEESRKPRARPTSTAFTAAENRLLSQLYLANKEQYHAKSRVAVGAKAGQTSQERYATQFAAELTKLGFSRRSSTQVKQRIADIRKLAHKLAHREVGTDKKNKSVVVEPWLQNVIVALGQEGQEKEERQNREIDEVDKVSAMAQNVLDDHLQVHGEPVAKRRRSARNMASHEKINQQREADKNKDEGNLLLDNLEAEPMTVLQKKLALAQLRVALKTERLLDLKIKKMQVETTGGPLRQSSFAFAAEERPGDEEPADKAWKNESGITAQIVQEKNTADLIECLLTLKGSQP